MTGQPSAVLFPPLPNLFDASPGIVDLPYVRIELPVEHLAPDRHLQLVEGILHDVVRVQVVDPVHGHVDVGLQRLGEEQKLGAGQGGEALQPEVLRLQDLETRWRLGPDGQAARRLRLDPGLFERAQARRYCVDAGVGRGSSAGLPATL
jgi:hypothetical protein